MVGKGIPITKQTSEVYLLPTSCSNKQGGWRLNKPLHTNTKTSPGMCGTAETFSFSIPEHLWSATQQLSQGSVSQPLLGERTWKERCLETEDRNKLSQTLLQPAREMSHIAKLQLQDPGGNKMCLPGVCFDAFIQGFPLQKFKIVKWIQDWPLNHTYSSAKEKHVDARKPFGNKYIHITSAPWENIGSFLGPCWTEGNKDHLWKSLRGKKLLSLCASFESLKGSVPQNVHLSQLKTPVYD